MYVVGDIVHLTTCCQMHTTAGCQVVIDSLDLANMQALTRKSAFCAKAKLTFGGPMTCQHASADNDKEKCFSVQKQNGLWGPGEVIYR